MTIPREIEACALLGWRIYPCSRSTKAARFKGATSAATANLDIIDSWCHEYGPSNWRVVMAGSGIWSLDIDAPGDTHSADGINEMRRLVADNGPLPKRPMSRSGGGGYAIFFSHTNEKIIGQTGVPAPGIDPRRGNLSITIPPSIHVVTKHPYRWVTPPWEVNPPKAPEWLLSLVAPKPEPEYRAVIDTSDAARAKLYKAVGQIMVTHDGGRNATLNAKSYAIGRLIAAGLLGEQEAMDALYHAARSIGLDHSETKATIQSGIKAGMRNG